MGNLTQFALATLDALAIHIAVLDEHGTILAVNQAWRSFVNANAAHANVSEGANYLQICDQAVGTEATDAHAFAAGIRAVLANERDTFSLEYACHSPQEEYWFIGKVSRFIDQNTRYLVIAHENITERKQVELNLRRQNDIIETVNQAGQLLSTQLELFPLLQAITDAATKLSKAQFGAFFYNLINAQGESYSLYTLSGAPLEAFAKFPMPRNTEVFGPTFRGEGVIRSADIKQDPRYGKNPPYNGMPPGHLPVTSYLAVPVISRSGNVLGGLFFGHAEVGVFTDYEESLVTGLAAQAAIAIDNAQLYAQVYEENQRFRTTLLSIGDGVIATDKTGIVTFINPTAETITGWQAPEALGKSISTIFQIINEYTRLPVESPITKVLNHGNVVGLASHTLLITKEGHEKPIADSAAPIRNIAGEIVGTVLVFRDMTERRAAEKLLEERQQFIQKIANAVPDLIYVYDINTSRPVYSNHELFRVMGYDIETISQFGDTLFDTIIHPDDKALVYQRLQQFAELSDNQVLETEYRIRHKNGQWRWLSARDTIFQRGDDGQPLQILGVAQDITQRKEAETRLTRLQEITAELSKAVTLQQVLDVIVEQALAFMNVIAGIVFLLDETRKNLSVINAYNVSTSVLEQFLNVPVAQDFVVANAVRTGEAQWITNIQALQGRYPGSLELAVQAGSKAVAGLPLLVDGQIMGGLTLHFQEEQLFDLESRNYLLALAHQCAQAIVRAQLSEQAQQVAAIEERQRLARDLHDAVSQSLFSATVTAEALPRLWERDPQRAFDQLGQVIQLNRAAMAEMRTLLLELRPDVIVNNFLDVLLQQLVQAAKGRRNIQTELDFNVSNLTLPPDVHVTFYRIAQEAINNVMKHSKATYLKIQLHRQGQTVDLCIQDNGRGFNQERLETGLGLRNLKERATSIGVSLEIESEQGAGTNIALRWQEPPA